MVQHTYYTVKTSSCTFYAKVVQQYPNVHKVYFGGKKLCVAISVYLDMEEDAHPNIDTLAYNSECNIEGTLAQGKGTVHLLRSAMSFVAQMYPQHTQSPFELIDKSHITCTSPKNRSITIPLCYYYILKHGGTWYERKLGAVKKHHHEQYRTSVKNVLAMLKKHENKHDFSEFAETYGVPTFMRASLQKIYTKSNSTYEFIQHLLENYECYVLKDWMKNLVETHVKIYGDSWIIPYTSKNNVSLTVTKVDAAPTGVLFGGGTEDDMSYQRFEGTYGL